MNIDSSYNLKKEKSKMSGWTSAAVLFLGLAVVVGGFFVYPQVFASNARLEGQKDFSLTDPLLIRFSHSMIPQTFEDKVNFSPRADFKVRWQNKNSELIIYPAKSWDPETEYQVSIEGARNIMLVKRPFSFSFRTIGYPQVESFFPENESQNVVLDIEDPIQVKFKNSINDFKIKIAVDPPLDLESQVNLEEKKISLIPRAELEKGKKYSFAVAVKGKNEPDGNYRNIFSSAFSTKPEPPKVWEKDFAARIEQAKSHTEAQIIEGKYIDINVKSQIMTIFENGQILDAFLISSGKRGMDTPQGTFQIRNKFPRAWSKKYALFMPFWMAIVPNGDYGIHELPEWPGGYKEGRNHLGIPVSHGCVRLGVGPAERVYNWAEIGTPVVVHS